MSTPNTSQTLIECCASVTALGLEDDVADGSRSSAVTEVDQVVQKRNDVSGVELGVADGNEEHAAPPIHLVSRTGSSKMPEHRRAESPWVSWRLYI